MPLAAPVTRTRMSSAPCRRGLGEPVEPEVGELGAARVARRGIAAGEAVVGLSGALELLGGERHAGRRALAAERPEQLLRQHIGVAPDALARVERAYQVDAPLADL